jgi:hypothetical protein
VHIALALVAVAAIVGIEHLLGQGTLAWALPLPLALLAGEVIMRDAIRRDEKRDPPA